MANTVTYPLSAVVGYDIAEKIGKDQWIALAVDLLREQLGEGVANETIRAEVASRLDVLFYNGLIPRTLPKRYARASS